MTGVENSDSGEPFSSSSSIIIIGVVAILRIFRLSKRLTPFGKSAVAAPNFLDLYLFMSILIAHYASGSSHSACSFI